MSYNFMHDDTFDGSLMPLPTLHKAVWAWIISKAKPDTRAPGGGSVLLNPRLLVAYFPDQTVEAIAGVIDTFCEPDPESRTTLEAGRRLIPMGRDRYAVTGYETHAGSKLARDAQRKREWRERHRAAPQAEPPQPGLPVADRPATTSVPRGTLITSPRAYARKLDTHAFIGDGIEIPNALHAQLENLIGGQPTPERHAKLQAFYEHLNATRGTEPIPNLFKWVHARFEAWIKPAVTSPDTPGVGDDAYARELERSSTRHHSRIATQEEA